MIDYSNTVVESNGRMVALDCRHLSGVQGAAASLLNRSHFQRGRWVCRHSFRRVCRRFGASQKETRALLREMGVIEKWSSFTYGTDVISEEPVYLSFEDWAELGYRVKRGATSYARALSSGQALFNEFQVVNIRGEL